MASKMKKGLEKLVCAGMVVLALAGCANATLRTTLVDSNSIVEYGIEYYIQTDKSVYNLGESVEMLYRVTNVTDGNVKIGCALFPELIS